MSCACCGLPEAHIKPMQCITALRASLGSAEMRNEGLRRMSLRLASRQIERKHADFLALARSVEIERASSPAIWTQVLRGWKERPCLICERSGWCSHREPDVEIAVLEAKERQSLSELTKSA
jgi:hypothetical protein